MTDCEDAFNDGYQEGMADAKDEWVLARRPQRAAVAYIVADHWRRAALADTGEMQTRLMAHPLACVQAALDGETDPAQLGVDPSSPDAVLIVEACRGA